MGEYVLITGASSGIGKAFANEYAKMGRNLILVARNKDKLDNLKNGLKAKYNVDVKVIQLDLSLQDSANKLFERVEKEGIFVDTLINNAGFGLKGNLLSHCVEDYYEMMNLNMITLTGLTHMFFRTYA
ncbi:SDR family NAD(P)-dependent oxidoreductase [Clostridium butyricum]|uniref:SDR family NAD(P)-dependent oxidoreductase n=1 Tax=Clostridium butyricum TaxID=1492 RepID=UPI0013D0CCC6|nr:SDR family NAD(P)-dependent oxidoreductase [Clostridium butyricum]MDB2162312.1 SDR family NAD(P)-dependent oxidoreductase [Clostridium butyricum]NFB73347.1 SDR family NAD(P)-dependent oxidoreductase [Clostridium butyricum]NFB91192.1 SDR family NAD(P)-dependent oxidoreductase [Clostridium butyricum]UTY53186.1 SDR family NAD(P)-dependent oxidoreductase [Clostridium butyricum]